MDSLTLRKLLVLVAAVSMLFPAQLALSSCAPASNDNRNAGNDNRNAVKLWHPEKPIVYLYPEDTCDVSVTLSSPELLRCSYPEYDDGWTVTAHPDGSLVDLETGRSLYALYYESTSPSVDEYGSGFVIAGDESAAFLEEKLATLGLNEREAEEFIVYWLPKLEANSYNFIHFLTEEEIDGQMGLSIEPSPDSTIRVWMAFEGLDAPLDIEEQQLVAPERAGFIAVEWGGFEM